MVIVKKTKKFGRGVFSSSPIKKGTVIEVSDLIVLSSKKDISLVGKTDLYRYLYEFKNKQALALGIGSLFNHDDNANIEWEVLYKEQKIRFWAKEDIPKGVQLFINYGYDPLTN